MATKTHHIEAMPGLRDLYLLLQIINDPARYQHVLAELEQKRKDANDLIELTGPASGIPGMLQVAEAKLKQADKVLADTQAQAQSLLDEAAKRAENIDNEMAAKVAELNDRIAAFNATRRETEALLAEREAAVAAKATELAAQEKNLAALRSQNESMSAELKSKLEKLNALRAQL